MTQDNRTEAGRPWTNRLKRTRSFGPITHELTPFVLNDRLYRVENHPRFLDFQTDDPTFRFHEDEIAFATWKRAPSSSAPCATITLAKDFSTESACMSLPGTTGRTCPGASTGRSTWSIRTTLSDGPARSR